MAYLKPNAFTRKVFNPLALRTGVSGSRPLAVVGRRTGQRHEVPVIPVEHGGHRYVVCPRGEAEWVRNVRAAGEVELGRRRRSRADPAARKGSAERLRATEVPVAERGPIIEAYRAKAGRAVASYWEQLPDPADHPVFRLG